MALGVGWFVVTVASQKAGLFGFSFSDIVMGVCVHPCTCSCVCLCLRDTLVPGAGTSFLVPFAHS